MRAEIRDIHRRLARLEAAARARGDGAGDDRARFAWFAHSCPCGRPAGECAAHPRARESQRPPGGDWRTWLLLMGRAAGKTRAAAEWVRHRVESGSARRLALVGATAADVRDVMIEGPSGLLAIGPPRSRPRYEPSKRRLTWPNGAVATAYHAEEPDRLRGPQHDAAWCDELAAWRYPAAFENVLWGLRIGSDPRLCATATPRRVPLIMRLLSDPATAITRATTYDNRAHLPPEFFRRIISRFEGTRLGRQELMGELLGVSEGAWFARFNPAEHIDEKAEYDPAFPVHLAIDCGVSRHTAAVWFQVRPSCQLPVPSSQFPVVSCQFPVPSKTGLRLATGNSMVTVFGDWHGEGFYPDAAAEAILAHSRELSSGGRVDAVQLDPAGAARTGIGPPACEAFRTGLRSLDADVLAQAPRRRRPGPARGPARQGPAADPPALRGADGGVPELHQATDVAGRVARRAGRPAAPPRGPDRRPPRRPLRPLPHRPAPGRDVPQGAGGADLPRMKPGMENESEGRTMSELRAIPRSFNVEATMPVTTLKSVQCAERRGHPKEWTLDGLTLGQINLIVGTNATGKSRTINAINNLARMLFPEAKTRAVFAEYDVLFDSDGHRLRYVVEVNQGKVIREEFYRDEEQLLQRGPSGEGEIFAEAEKKKIPFKPPESDLAAVFRRDSLQHSFLEPLHDWASSVRHYEFGSSLGKDRFAVFTKDGPEPDERDANQVVGVFAKAHKLFGNTFVGSLNQDMKRMGYDVDAIEMCIPELLTILPPRLPGAVQGIGVRERVIGGIIDQFEMSQGMFRALSILIQVNYAAMAHRSYCILIDDIGEGLDFERSTRLIELLREKALESSFQLIMATNDRFVMDHVPLEEWSVLQRHGGHVRVLNYGNSPELFEDFKFTGLSNFSFLETDFAKGPIEEATAHE